jgi:hypothetical protein
VPELALYALLAMQKVEGSNPFSRSSKDLRLQVFFVGAVAGALASPGIFCSGFWFRRTSGSDRDEHLPGRSVLDGAVCGRRVFEGEAVKR